MSYTAYSKNKYSTFLTNSFGTSSGWVHQKIYGLTEQFAALLTRLWAHGPNNRPDTVLFGFVIFSDPITSISALYLTRTMVNRSSPDEKIMLPIVKNYLILEKNLQYWTISKI